MTKWIVDIKGGGCPKRYTRSRLHDAVYLADVLANISIGHTNPLDRCTMDEIIILKVSGGNKETPYMRWDKNLHLFVKV